MDRKKKIEQCRTWAKEIMAFLSQVLGEMDAAEDFARIERSKLKIIAGGQAEKEDKGGQDK